ncbi:LacI family transcriptional regulator [Parabacteroides sp. PF5-5]|uniref:LacI family DNA-binding transcriptional regulator n=1 Tax=unclassified Parabacteroides TaxID=2649774 RepID=UPI0024753F86|nr:MULTISPECIES: LacI family DNA-binding transcriptional regulator [unclassified Parabacteroides]MDH6306567.1 LacI family transcriptional regulator [Parabacteroides sp. PH5-39]MDH6317534.1 LacI family transcriptional regulator [Parabacteroides sp. PF5-13]MDH6321278.1 LacI family transcriptional regulator [Parabacteroides sp. PH5-13]MDH6325010.1 LacI family transcriptional regulator [Parabacteroides sp. PH5-8]MDH6328719.1 LacI family transcriptional regulator [Parabacteroides sp. PH5-41]
MKKVLIKDVAKKAGVSNATVSLVLNGKEKEGRVGKEVAERVRKIAAEMNYQPNALARSLQSGRTYIIGLIVADISNPFFSTLAYYVQDQIEKAGYAVMIMNTNENDDQLEKIIGMLKNHQVDGYVIVPTENGEASVARLLEAKCPLVLLDRNFPDLKTYSVMVDGYQASFQATNLLIERGCKRIGLLIYNSFQAHMSERKYGFVDALQRNKSYDPDLVEYVNFNNLEEDVLNAMDRLVKKKVDGLLIATNTIAMLGIKDLFERKIKIPEQIQVVCFDKSDAFEFMPNPIPYIQQPIEVMGRKAADLLMEQMEKKDSEVQVCKFPASLVRR